MPSRQCFERDGVGVIPLKNGLEALVDISDLSLVAGFSWYLLRGGRANAPAYPARKIRVNGKAKNQRLHQLLLPAVEGMVIDHIDRNPLNNCRSNLRYASRSLNGRNVRRGDNVGLRLKPTTGKWSAVLFLGEFKTKAEARDAYDRAYRLLFPE